MFKTEFFGPRNLLVIAIFAVVWQLILSRANSFLHTKSAQSPSDVAA